MFGNDIAAYLPQQLKPLADLLKQFPTGFEKWVYATSAPPETYQGDVVTGIPFVAVDENGDVLRLRGTGNGYFLHMRYTAGARRVCARCACFRFRRLSQ